ncbi:unnamed protein product [Phyllotreta striolata]|uniref:Odorant receptor n=1 Tax=Phyllotreta striolata TaxID=444603 RepID=A0A9P0GUX1_PHYSR|nr:unnamed protein product [Phyllotreta striolata]
MILSYPVYKKKSSSMENEIKRVSMSFSIKLFQYYGGFPQNHEFLNPGKIFYIKFVVKAVLSSFLLIGSILHLVHSIIVNIFNHVELDVAYSTALLIGYFLMLSLILKMDKIGKFYTELSNFKEYEKPMDFEETNRRYNKYALMHFIYIMIFVLTSSLFSNIFKIETCRRENMEKGIHEVCGLYLYVWLPFNIDFTPVKQIYAICQIISTTYVHTFIGVCAWMVLESSEHVSIRFKHSGYLYSLAGVENDARKKKILFHKAIKYHKYSIRLGELLAEIYYVFMFAHMFMTSVILGYDLYAFLKTYDVSTFIMSIAWVNGVFMVSHGGQRLQDMSRQVGDEVYASNWTDYDISMQKEVSFVIMRCQKHMSLKAIFIGDVGYMPFLSVLKAAYSYVMLMTNTGS